MPSTSPKQHRFMEAVAHSHFARFSYRKVGQVLRLIRGKSVPEAFGMLPWIPRACRVLVEKTLKSAVANAGAVPGPAALNVSKAWVNHGPVMQSCVHRWIVAQVLVSSWVKVLAVTVP